MPSIRSSADLRNNYNEISTLSSIFGTGVYYEKREGRFGGYEHRNL